jgi:hypothetical protein
MNPIPAQGFVRALVVLGLGIVAGAIIDASGVTSWLLILCVSLSIIMLLQNRLGWVLAVPSGIVLLLAIDLVSVRVLQPIPVGLDVKNRALLVLIAAVVVAMLWRNRNGPHSWSPRKIRTLVYALAPFVLVLSAGAIAAALSAGNRVAWSMQNDAVWNTITARFLWADQGISPNSSFVSPLVQTLLAGSFAAGRDRVSPGALLQFDVTRQSELWLLLVLASCILAALVAWKGLPDLSPVRRGITVFLVGCIPFSWYAAGNAFQFGFFNATIALIGLLSAWLAWVSATEHRLPSIVLMAGVTLVLLGTWAPLGIVSMFLGSVIVGGAPRSWWAVLGGVRLAIVLVSVASTPAYLALVTLADLLRDGKSLTANGGMVDFELHNIIFVSSAALLSSGMVARFGRRRSAHSLVGVSVIVGASAVAIAYLVLQRSTDPSPWGYYPQKFSWLVATLLVIVIAVDLTAIALPVFRLRLRLAWNIAASALMAALLILPAPTRTSVALVAMATTPVPQRYSAATTSRLFEASDPASFTIFARYGSSEEDAFVNSWLVQQRATSDRDPIRAYAYLLDGSSIEQLCGLSAASQSPPKVRTRDVNLRSLIYSTCPSIDLVVVVG